MDKCIDLEELKDIYRLNVTLMQASEAIYKVRELELKKYSISPEQARALVAIYHLGKDAIPSRISRWLFREPHTVLVMLNRMEKLGMIKKESDTTNKHIIKVRLTDKGYEIHHHVSAYYSFLNIFGNIPKRKRQQLYSLLQLLRNKAFENLSVNSKAYSEMTAAITIPFSAGDRSAGPAGGRPTSHRKVAQL